MGNVAVPVLPVDDLARSLAFYTRLGFEIRSEYDGYAILGFGDAELHLAQNDMGPDYFSWSGAYLRVDDADAVHAAWAVAGARIIKAPTDEPYGIREFATEDPDGNLWRIGSPLAGPDEPDRSGHDGADDGEAPAGTATDPGPADVTDDASSTSEPGEPPTDGSVGTNDASWFEIVTGGGRCAGCGLVAADGAAEGLPARLLDEADRWRALLDAADDDAVRFRPDADTWSALEYAVHVRDTLGVFTERVARMLVETDPDLGWWDHEAAIADGMANELEVASVSDDLVRRAGDLRAALARVDGDTWQRRGVRRGSETFTIESTARFAVHELVHHRGDAQRSLAAGLAAR